PPLLGRLHPRPRSRLDAPALVRRRRPRGDGGLVPREPRVVGADQVRRVPGVLRRAVRRTPRQLTSGTASATVPGDEPQARRRLARAEAPAWPAPGAGFRSLRGAA